MHSWHELGDKRARAATAKKAHLAQLTYTGCLQQLFVVSRVDTGHLQDTCHELRDKHAKEAAADWDSLSH